MEKSEFSMFDFVNIKEENDKANVYRVVRIDYDKNKDETGYTRMFTLSPLMSEKSVKEESLEHAHGDLITECYERKKFNQKEESMENESFKYKVGDKVYVRGDNVLHTVEGVVPMCRIIDGRTVRQGTNYWVSDGLPFPHDEGELTSKEEMKMKKEESFKYKIGDRVRVKGAYDVVEGEVTERFYSGQYSENCYKLDTVPFLILESDLDTNNYYHPHIGDEVEIHGEKLLIVDTDVYGHWHLSDGNLYDYSFFEKEWVQIVKCAFCGRCIPMKDSDDIRPIETTKGSRCCHECNANIVLPTREKILFSSPLDRDTKFTTNSDTPQKPFKRPVGRPKKKVEEFVEQGPKRQRGRPRKDHKGLPLHVGDIVKILVNPPERNRYNFELGDIVCVKGVLGDNYYSLEKTSGIRINHAFERDNLEYIGKPVDFKPDL